MYNKINITFSHYNFYAISDSIGSLIVHTISYAALIYLVFIEWYEKKLLSTI